MTTLRPLCDQVSVQVADDPRKIMQLVSATLGSLTIKISRGKVAEHVQNTGCSDRKSQAVQVLDGRTTIRRWSCVIAGDRGIIQSLRLVVLPVIRPDDRFCAQSCGRTIVARPVLRICDWHCHNTRKLQCCCCTAVAETFNATQ